jgi:catechol 2,3-dioxygenase-like lactoylglutathione lyase family enzyme
MSGSIIGVSEIVLSVNDLPAMREFYIEMLGFSLHSETSLEGQEPDPDGEPTITFLKIVDVDTPLGKDRHPQLLVLIDWQRHVYAKGRFKGHDITRSTLNHLAFEVAPENYESEFDRLSALNLNPVKTEFPRLNAKAIFFKDPESNVLELICRAGIELAKEQ